MKHAEKDDGGATAKLEFRPESNDDFIMFSIIGLKYLDEKLGAEEIAFERWHTFRNPNIMSDAGKAEFAKSFTVEQLEIFRSIHKNKFLETFRLLVRQPDAQQK